MNIGFTGDNVELNGKPEAKAGRKYRPNPRLERVQLEKESVKREKLMVIDPISFSVIII